MRTLSDLLEFVLAKEDEAAALYESLASRAKRESMRELFTRFAAQERGHKKDFARIVKESDRGVLACDLPPAAGLSEYLVDVPFTPDMSYQDTLILAMKREEHSSALYRRMAGIVPDPALAEVLNRMACEEEHHKAGLENLYDRDVLTED
jgi:rubrerythrin